MLARIQEALEELDVTVLFAVESGSRAWGFPSPDSDWDVRFVYLHPRDWYLSVLDRKDTLDRPIQEGLDLGGWELRKALRLFANSNAAVYEWLQSPILYREQPGFREAWWELASQHFSPRITTSHYLGVARNAARDIGRLKKVFYVLRPVLAARWIEQRGEVPPMSLDRLRQMLPDELAPTVDALLEEKSRAGEAHTREVPSDLRAFLEEELARLRPPPEERVESYERVDEFFRATLERYG